MQQINQTGFTQHANGNNTFTREFLHGTNTYWTVTDGTNDYFVVDNHGIETLNMLIFNRWGAKVYEWNTAQTAWDGTGLDGEDVADGVYYYILTAVGEDGHPYEERGAVTLIR